MEFTNSQKLVINENNKSLLVSASAGSGKTFVVVERIIEKIKNGMDIDNMLILTFTNAAASELKERIISRLYSLKEEYISTKKTKEAKRILRQISLVPASDISTIHSFCLQIIKSNFYILGIDPNVLTLDANKSYIKLLEYIEEYIEEEYENGLEVFLDILDMVGGEQNLIDVLYSIYKNYLQMDDSNKWLDDAVNEYLIGNVDDLCDTELGKFIIEYIKEKVTVLKIELENLIDKLDSLDDFETRKEVLLQIKSKLEKCISLKKYDDIFHCMKELLDFPKMPSTKVSDEELKEEVKKVKNKVSNEIKSLSKILYKDTKEIVSELNMASKYVLWYKEAILKIHEKFTKYKNENGFIDFSDYEQLTLKALNDENTCKRYMDKYDEIYIDEYQDTSYIQESIIKKISKNNVIMVGDVKQSIYGFRNAAPELFSNKYEMLEEVIEENVKKIPAAKIILAKNFRSRKEVINITNLVFGKLMSLEFGGAKYSEREKLVCGANYEENKGCMPELHIIEKNDVKLCDEDEEDVEETLSKLEVESVAVSKKILELTNGSFKVYDLKEKNFRPCEYKDIVILMRTVENKANIVENTLKEFGIPAYSDAKTGFLKSDEILLIISFLKLLNNPLDDIALASVMYSIIGKFTLDEMTYLRQKNKSEYLIYALNEDVKNVILKQKVINFKELLERFKIYLNTYSISYVLNRLYNETGLYVSLGFEKLGKIKQANLDAFLQIVSDFENSENTTTLHRLIKYLDTLKAKESSGDSPKQLGENENVVRIMTMHKSKGLEFPVVILMNTEAKYNERELTDKVIADDKYKIGIDIYNKEMSLTYPSIVKQVMKLNIKSKLRSEALRLLYVAFTRAKEKLIIYGTLNGTFEQYTKDLVLENNQVSLLSKFNANSHLKCILQAVLQDSNNLIDITIHNYEEFKTKNKQDVLDRNKNTVKAFLNNIQKIKIEKEAVDEIKKQYEYNYKYDTDIYQKYTVTQLKQKNLQENLCDLKPNVLEIKISGTSYGTIMHKIVELVDYKNVSRENIELTVKNVLENIDQPINENKIVEGIYKLYSKHLKELLKDAKEVKHELEFVIEDDLDKLDILSLKEPTLIQGVVDMYIKSDTQNVIIDFKTDRVSSDDELIEKYEKQLKIYKRALEVAYNINVDKTYIYSFALEKLIEVN